MASLISDGNEFQIYGAQCLNAFSVHFLLALGGIFNRFNVLCDFGFPRDSVKVNGVTYNSHIAFDSKYTMSIILVLYHHNRRGIQSSEDDPKKSEQLPDLHGRSYALDILLTAGRRGLALAKVIKYKPDCIQTTPYTLKRKL